MKTVKFVYVEDLVTGLMGFIPHTTKLANFSMASMEGVVAAHDLLEHVNGLTKIGTIEDELEALGAVIYVRLENGCNNISVRGVAVDIINLFEASNHLSRELIKPKNTKPIKNGYGADAYIDDLLCCFVSMVENEFFNLREKNYITDEDIENFCVLARNYMRIGYRKAVKKYPNQWGVYMFFNTLSKTLDKAFSAASEYLSEGETLTVRYSLAQNYAHASIYGDDD